MQPIQRSVPRTNIAFFTLLFIGFFAIFGTTYAWTSPRITLCEKQFIGYEYNPKYEPICKDLWKKWTKEILNNSR